MYRMTKERLLQHIAESNMIEGIGWDEESAGHAGWIDPEAQVPAHIKLFTKKLSVASIVDFVSTIAPHAAFRNSEKVPGVRVGGLTAPPSGPGIEKSLLHLLDTHERGAIDVYNFHKAYEELHPFTDGNGRSGRAIWLHMMGPQVPDYGFLQWFYYRTLAGMV